MKTSIATIRRRIRQLAPVLGLLLVTVMFVGGAHHHADGTHHACAVCTVGHSTAITTDTAGPTAAPTGAPQAVHAPVQCALHSARPATATSRAPPLA